MYIIPIAITLILEAVIFATGIALCMSMFKARGSAAPFYPTPKSAIRKALKEVALTPGEIFYDLGAGTGIALVIAEKEFGARAIGFEISSLPYGIARINLFLQRSNAKLLARDFFQQDLRDAGVVFCFLAIRTMQKMETKLKAELKPGARVIVYAFPLPTMTPTKIITVHREWKMFIYRMS